jgi:hypothetical protein
MARDETKHKIRVMWFNRQDGSGEVSHAYFHTVESLEGEDGKNILKCHDYESDIGEDAGGWEALMLEPKQVIKIDFIVE